MNRNISIAFLLLIASGCASLSSTRDGAPLAEGMGLLVMQVTSDRTANLSYVDYSPTSTFGSRWTEYMAGPEGSVRFDEGQSYWVLQVKEGEYMWSKFSFGNMFSNIQSSNHFVVKRNAMTYIGHLYVRVDLKTMRFDIRVEDDSSDMQEHLAKNFPKFNATMPFDRQITQMKSLSCGSSGFGTCYNDEAARP